jgi:predicted DNA-binding transcriptional regulator YafY
VILPSATVMIETSHYPVYATVLLKVPLAEAQRLIPPGSGTHEPDGPNTRVSIGGADLDNLATRLLSLVTPFSVLAPDDLRETLRRRVQAQLDAL